MSRTRNTDPYRIQAARRRGTEYHRCAERTPDHERRSWPLDHPCNLDDFSSKVRGSDCGYDLRIWAHCRSLWGGWRVGQHMYANQAERAERTRVHNALRIAVQLANADLEATDDIDIWAAPRDISWDLW